MKKDRFYRRRFLKSVPVAFTIGLLLLGSFSGDAQSISPYLFGQNAWEPSGLRSTRNMVAAVKYGAIRIGGNGYENAGFIAKALLPLIAYVRSVGAEPIVQLPRQLQEGDKAYEAIAYINGEMKQGIRFWSIGNEPDHKNQLAAPAEVASYFKKISAGIKRYDSTAVVMGFDLSSYSVPYIDSLLGGALDVTGRVPGKHYYYLDIVSFHGYRFVDVSRLEREVDDLLQRLERCNKSRPSAYHLGWAITEFNTHWKVDPAADERLLPYTFYNGQLFAELYDLGMRKGAFAICPWSILEGGADREGTDLSMFDLVDGNYYPRSNYYHTRMLSLNRKDRYLAHDQVSKDLVVIPMGDPSGTAVMIINKSRNIKHNYTLHLRLHGQTNGADLISIDARKRKKITGSIAPFSTQMLIFDKRGRLAKQYDYSASEEDPSRISPVPVIKNRVKEAKLPIEEFQDEEAGNKVNPLLV